MSANQDKNEKFTFLYLNLYKINKKLKEGHPEVAQAEAAAQPIPVSRKLYSGQVLKTAHLHQKPSATYVNSSYYNEAIESLKGSLKSLNDLHSRLRFMLQEIEELVNE